MIYIEYAVLSFEVDLLPHFLSTYELLCNVIVNIVKDMTRKGNLMTWLDCCFFEGL